MARNSNDRYATMGRMSFPVAAFEVISEPEQKDGAWVSVLSLNQRPKQVTVTKHTVTCENPNAARLRRVYVRQPVEVVQTVWEEGACQWGYSYPTREAARVDAKSVYRAVGRIEDAPEWVLRSTATIQQEDA